MRQRRAARARRLRLSRVLPERVRPRAIEQLRRRAIARRRPLRSDAPGAQFHCPSRSRISVGQSLTQKLRPSGRPGPSSTSRRRKGGADASASAIAGAAAWQWPPVGAELQQGESRRGLDLCPLRCLARIACDIAHETASVSWCKLHSGRQDRVGGAQSKVGKPKRKAPAESPARA